MTKKRILPVVLSAPTAAGVLVACDIDKSEAGELPDVEVDESGDLPEWDVDWADVDAGTTEETVTVPKLKVVMEEETVEVPYIDIGNARRCRHREPRAKDADGERARAGQRLQR